MTTSLIETADKSVEIHILDSEGFARWAQTAAASARTAASARGFTGALGQKLILHDAEGAVAAVLFGWGSDAQRRRGRFHLAGLVADLPPGAYHLADVPTGFDPEEAALGWLLAGYDFQRYRPAKTPSADISLVVSDAARRDRAQAIAAGEFLTRDLINTPASDMGPDDLEAAARDLAGTHGATIAVTAGDDLIAANFPMIHAVGRASAQAPRLIDMAWGRADAPRVTLVGKGVCFDTGGLNIKPSSSMGLMKKDMGGAATVLGLAHMIMATGVDIRLRVLIPAVENAISGSAFRPQDILTSRKGLTVEINNTDAEGRLVLADALALADEETPELIVSMATLTGAARVAVGPDLSPYYTDHDADAAALDRAAALVADPVWRMPFWEPYEAMIEPGIADLDNAPKGGMAGSITAALFLRRFVTETPRYMHFDIYGWQPTAAPGRPKGGVGMGARALLAGLAEMVAR